MERSGYLNLPHARMVVSQPARHYSLGPAEQVEAVVRFGRRCGHSTARATRRRLQADGNARRPSVRFLGTSTGFAALRLVLLESG